MPEQKMGKPEGSELSKARLKEREAMEKGLQRRKGPTDIGGMFGFPTKEKTPQQAPTQEKSTQVVDAQAVVTQVVSTQVPTTQVSKVQIILDEDKREDISRPADSYTALPNEIFDGGLIRSIIRDCKGAVPWTVWLFMYRWSYGFGRNYTQASIADMVDKLGVSDRSIKDALKHLQEKKYIRKFEARSGLRSTYIVGRPARESNTQVVTTQVPSTQAQSTQDPGTHYPGPRNSLPNKKEKRKKVEKKNIPPLPPSKGEPQLKIETSRWREKAPVWEPWETVHNRLREILTPEEFYPISCARYAVRGLGRSIHIRGSGLTPEVLSEPLKKALAETLTEQGIDTLRIAV